MICGARPAFAPTMKWLEWLIMADWGNPVLRECFPGGEPSRRETIVRAGQRP